MYPTSDQADCPRCGSLRKQRLPAGRYRCADCGLNYHLEWVGTQVQVRQPTAPRPSPSARWDWLPLKTLLVVVGALLVLAAFSCWVAPGR